MSNDGVSWSRVDVARTKLGEASLRILLSRDDRDLVFDIQELRVDLSRNLIDKSALEILADDIWPTVAELRNQMYAGKTINNTENRKVLHVALRDLNSSMPEAVKAQRVLGDMFAFANSIREGSIVGSSGKKFKTILNVGIGGSDLGPRMAYEALRPFAHPEIELRFVSNVDPEVLDVALSNLDLESTLVVVVSKTFTTVETITNYERIRARLAAVVGPDVDRHFVGVTANADAAKALGISRTFPMWDWVGGRYSLASAVGLSLLLAIGEKNFQSMLDGMHEIDEHFRTAAPLQNVPFLLGAIDAWYIRYFAMHSRAVVPYASALGHLPSYLQQLEMESNGKRVRRNGQETKYSTAIPVWGGPGTDGQHAYFQFLHQGTEFVSIDFIGFAKTRSNDSSAHEILLANMVAQIEALTFGSESELDGDTKQVLSGATNNSPDRTNSEHKYHPGNKPCNVILAESLTPYVLGQLIALYEHRVFVQGAIWDINSFDQWGVELGKKLAGTAIAQLRDGTSQSTGENGAKAPAVDNTMIAWLRSHLG